MLDDPWWPDDNAEGVTLPGGHIAAVETPLISAMGLMVKVWHTLCISFVGG